MSPYAPNDDFSDVKTYDTSDPVLGGLDGESNQPVELLADRTEWLYNRLGGYKDVVEITGSQAIDATHANKLLVIVANTNVTLTVAGLAAFKRGNILKITAAMSGGPFWVNVVPEDLIYDGSVPEQNIWLYNSEMIELVAGDQNWKWTDAKGNYGKVGTDDLKRIQPRNTFVADGNLGDLRAQYPRLWKTVSGTAVSDSQWSINNLRFRGLFSTGNGTTTFRRPDMRSMSYKGLDLGRGLGLGRMDEMAGGYEPDVIKSHTHLFDTDGDDQLDNNPSGYPLGRQNPENPSRRSTFETKATGGTENTVKTIGLIPVIYY